MSYLVNLQYYKKSGKYYSSGEYITKKEQMWKIFDEVERMSLERRLPNLVRGHSDFIVHVSVEDCDFGYPGLVIINER